MKKILFISFLATILLSLLSHRAGNLAGFVYITLLFIVFFRSTYRYFFIREMCRTLEMMLHGKDKLIQDYEISRQRILDNLSKLSNLILELQASPYDSEQTKKYVKVLQETKRITEENIVSYEKWLNTKIFEADLFINSFKPIVKENLSIYKSKDYPFYYKPSEKILNAIAQ